MLGFERHLDARMFGEADIFAVRNPARIHGTTGSVESKRSADVCDFVASANARPINEKPLLAPPVFKTVASSSLIAATDQSP